MNHEACQVFRDGWLERALECAPEGTAESDPGSSNGGVRRDHTANCDACESWLRSSRVQVILLRSLERLSPPADLESILGAELDRGGRTSEVVAVDPRLEALLRGLPERSAPRELDELVATGMELHGAEFESPVIHTLRNLEGTSPSSVLERLVDEELHAPAAHRVERFVGNLEPKPAPPELTLRVQRMLRRRRSPILATLGSLAAASLVVWMVATGFREEPELVRRLRVIRVDTQSEISPLARGLAASLNGGWIPTPGDREDRG